MQKADKPWERQKIETAQAYEAFLIYRDMGADRSITKVAQRLNKSRALIGRWSGRWNWSERIRAYDNEMDKRAQAKAAKDRKAMVERHIGIAVQLQAKALQALQILSAEELTAKDIVTMVDVSAKLERLSRGEVTERTEGKQTIAGKVQTESVRKLEAVNLDKLTDEELEQLYETVAKLAAE